MRVTGKCIKCGKRTQGKYKTDFMCKLCSSKINEHYIREYLNSLNDFDLGWLSGMIEGEGCFYCKESNSTLKNGKYCYPLAGFALMSTDLDIMQKLSLLLNIKLNGPYYKGGKKKRKTVWSVQITGAHAILIMNHFKPFLGKRRQVQIEEAIKWQESGKFRAQQYVS